MQAPSGGGELVGGALNGIENGRHNPSRTEVKAFQERIGISYSQLVRIALSEEGVEAVKLEVFFYLFGHTFWDTIRISSA